IQAKDELCDCMPATKEMLQSSRQGGQSWVILPNTRSVRYRFLMLAWNSLKPAWADLRLLITWAPQPSNFVQPFASMLGWGKKSPKVAFHSSTVSGDLVVADCGTVPPPSAPSLLNGGPVLKEPV